MKSYKFKNLRIGQSSFFKIKIKKELIKKFVSISKDYSKIHISKKFANQHGFRDKIGHGMILGAFYSRLIGIYLPGKFSLLISMNIKFNKPIYLNDVIFIKGKIIHLNKSYRVVTIKIIATNQLKNKVSEAKALVKLNA